MPQVQEIKRDKKRIKETLYAVEIKFRGMTKTVGLTWKDLNFSGEKLTKLQESKFKLKGIPVFNKLAEKAKHLTSLKNDWEYKRTIYVDGQKLVTESQFEPCLKDIAEMKALSDRYRQELLLEREEGIAAIKEKVTTILSQFDVSEKEIQTKLLQIERDFPSEDEIKNLLLIETKYIRIKSLIEQLETEKEQEEVLNKELEIKALKELRESKEKQIKQLVALKDKIFQEAEKIVLQILSEQLDKCQTLEIGENNKCVRNKIEKHLDKLNALMDLDLSGNFNEVKEELEQLHLFLTNNAGVAPKLREKIELQFIEIHQSLETTYQDILRGDNKSKKIRTSKLLVA